MPLTGATSHGRWMAPLREWLIGKPIGGDDLQRGLTTATAERSKQWRPVMTTTFKKSIIAAMGGLFLATNFAGAATAGPMYKPGKLGNFKAAGPIGPKPHYPKPYYPKPHYPKPYHPGYGGVGLGVGLGLGALAVGAAVASGAAYAEEECTIVRRRIMDDEGNVYVRRVQVCE